MKLLVPCKILKAGMYTFTTRDTKETITMPRVEVLEADEDGWFRVLRLKAHDGPELSDLFNKLNKYQMQDVTLECEQRIGAGQKAYIFVQSIIPAQK